MAKSPKPQKPADRARTARRARIAKAKIAGQSTAEIARTEGMSRDWISQELKSAECQQIVIGLVRDNYSEVERLFKVALTAIDGGLQADKVANDKGEALNLGADHFARLTAVKRLLDVLSLGRATAKFDGDSKIKESVSYEDLCRIVDERRKTEAVQ